MSVVIVKKTSKEIIIGSDSIRVNGWTQEKDKKAKLWKINDDMILGFAGLCSIGTLFREWLKTNSPKINNEDGIIDFIIKFNGYLSDMDKDLKSDKSDFIFIYKKKIYYIEGFFVREIEDYYAIGAGMDYALSALYLGHNVEKSIETACELSVYCEKPINIIKIKL